MKIISFKKLKFTPASHEDKNDPGALKKVLFTCNQLIKGKIQMINWAVIPQDKSFSAHYHEDMEEIFIIVSGKAKIIIEKEEAKLSRGDAVLIPIRHIHRMENVGRDIVEYIAIGISKGQGGKTVVV